ncbi:hypothetical protein LCL96_17085 [Rossellomorea aquimaris]|uniref:hypothetical protein n=1 Tax=Rossellomorea TaxID=2837508 RepID=UPI001CD7891F|nr:hypothetical protein [Rossellomorea aquimaris]MCA1060653.1 hypothetical protein [Rossellomorea aquimaris]
MNKLITISAVVIAITTIIIWLTTNATNAISLLAAYGIILSYLVYFSFYKRRKR